jgi:hypothetical protein
MKFRPTSPTMFMLDLPFVGPNEWESKLIRKNDTLKAVFDAGWWWCVRQHGEPKSIGVRDSDDDWIWSFFGFYPLRREGTLRSGIYFKDPNAAFHFRLACC